MNTLKIAVRNIQKNGTYSWINIIGLTLAFTLCLLVFSVVIEENSFDKSWKNSSQIYRITTLDSTEGLESRIPSAYANLASEWKKNFPEVESESAIISGKVYLNTEGSNSEPFEAPALRADANIFDLLDLKVLEGKPVPIIEGKKNLVISKSFKEQYFKDQEVIGKVVFNANPFSSKKEEFVITTVIDDLPSNSIFRTSAIELGPKNPMELSKDGYGFYMEQYILLKKGTDVSQFSIKANQWYTNFLNDSKKNKLSYQLQPLQEIYMEPLGMTEISGNKKNSLIFQGIAILVLVISCINFINLYAIRTIRKVKAINLFKIMGASKSQLIKGLLTETSILFMISFVLSSILYLLGLSPLEKFLNTDLSYIKSLTPIILALSFAGCLVLSLVIGLYPAWIVSNVKSADALKNKISKSSFSEVFTKRSLIVLQFCISLIVIIGLITIKSQLNLIQSTPRGLNTENILSIKTFRFGAGPEVIKNELSRIPGVEKTSITSWTPNIGSGYMARSIKDIHNPGKEIQVSFITGDTDLISLLDIRLTKGRYLRPSDYEGYSDLAKEGQDPIRNALITESTANRLGITELGKLNEDLGIIPVGIIADFHSESFHKKQVPTVITAIQLNSWGNVLIKIKEGQEKASLTAIDNVLKSHFPDRLINYEWVDEVVAKSYAKETQQAQLFTFFSFLALFISALGVTGLIYQSVEQRNKEIGIRKVLGATIYRISSLFSKEYVLMSILAIMISGPIAWYLCNLWLEDFAYKIDVQWWFFILAGLIVLVVTLITVNIQTIRAALTNPVDSLRDE